MARKAISNDRYRLVGTYERLRKNLVDRPDDGRLDKALSYWVLPTDRRLPIAFLDRPLRDLLSQPFDELIATPGVGHKKILGFFDLKQCRLRSRREAHVGDPQRSTGSRSIEDDKCCDVVGIRIFYDGLIGKLRADGGDNGICWHGVGSRSRRGHRSDRRLNGWRFCGWCCRLLGD